MLTCWLGLAAQLGLNCQTGNTDAEMQKFYWPSRGQTSYSTCFGQTTDAWQIYTEREFKSGYPTLCFPVNTSSNTMSSVSNVNYASCTQRFTSKRGISVNSMQSVKSSDGVSTCSLPSVASTEGLSVSSIQSVASTGGVSVSVRCDQSGTKEKRPGKHTVVVVGGESNQAQRCPPRQRQGNKTWSQNTYKQVQHEYSVPHVPQKGERKSVWSIDYGKHDYENISDTTSSQSHLEDKLAKFSNKYKEQEPENPTRKTPRSQKRPKGPRTVFRSKSCERISSTILDNLSCMARSGRSSPAEIDPYLQEHGKVR